MSSEFAAGIFADSATLALARELIRRPSVTPSDAGCQALIGERLAALGFRLERLRFGEVDNLWARLGSERPLMVFAGHTDVVPPGPLARWDADPFDPVVREGHLYGRGAADMKGSLAAMVVACERFLMATPQPHGSLALLLTSDEEGPAVDGTRRVIETLQTRAEAIDWCLVGEPSSEGLLGDTAKIGRRGSLHGHLRLLGQQGHVAYPLLAENPIHGAGGLIVCLAQEVWDLGNEFFPPTTFQISNIHGGTGVSNVIPGEITLQFNFRFCPESSPESLRQRTVQLIERHLSNEELRAQRRYGFELDWDLAGEPFLTPLGELVEAAQSASLAVLGRQPRLSTAGGTSDGRFIAPTGAQVLELGPINASIHKVNEHVAVADLDRLSELYEAILVRLLGG